MSLGGGTWMFQNKKLPGTYINFISKVRAKTDIADRGYGTMPLISPIISLTKTRQLTNKSLIFI